MTLDPPKIDPRLESHDLILFDGVCVLCNGLVDLVIKRDPVGRFRFSTLQSNLGVKVLKAVALPIEELGTMVLIEGGSVYTKSTAALRIIRRLQGLWPLCYIFIVVPPFIRNPVYDWVGRNRYRWFGKLPSCRVPNSEEQHLFID